MKTINILFVFALSLVVVSCHENIVESIEDDKGGVCITFDDTAVDQWYKMSSVFIDNKIKATFFVTMINTLPKSEIVKLQLLDSLGFEIGCHGLNHINAVDYLKTHSLQCYFDDEVLPAITIMNNIKLHPTSYSYPYGLNSDSLDLFLLNYFAVLRDVTEDQRKPLNKEVENIDEIFCKKGKSTIISSLGIDKNFNITINQLRKALQRAKKNKEILCVYAHNPVDSSASGYQIEISYIQSLLLLIKEYELNTYTFSELAK